MALELVSSRIFTPVFGSTTYTWGSLIGVILSGLSLGYFLGGKIADRKPSFEKICSIVFTVGLYITFIPFIAPSIIGFSIFVLPGSQFAPLVATFSLLIFPSILLGFVSPYAIKLGTDTLQKVGNISGNLYSIATIGSIVGTFTTVFLLIPTLKVTQIIFGLGLVLLASSLIGLKTPAKAITVGIFIILIIPWSSFSGNLIPHPGFLIYEGETPYSHLDVIDFGNTRTLFLDGKRHSAMNHNDPLALVIGYTEYFHLAKLINPNFKNVLFVGGGGFTGPKNFLLVYPDVKVDVVEIDPEVINVAKKYFAVKDDPRFRIFNEDARSFLSRTTEKYDVIILDAYATNYVPYHLLTDEFFKLLATRLNPDGIVISNLIGSLQGENSDLFRAVYKTIKNTFPTLSIFPTEHKISNIQNIMLVSSIKDRTLVLENLLYSARQNSVTYLIDDFEQDEHFYTEKIETNDVPILTDKFAPVDKLLNPITQQPYIIEELEYDTTRNDQKEDQYYGTIAGSLLVIAIIWIFYLIIIWKKQAIINP